MRHDLNYVKDVMPADRDPPWPRFGRPELEPIGGEPELTDGLAEHLDCHPASAEACARTAFGMTDDPRVMGFNARVAADNRSYLTAIGVLAFCLVLSLGTLFLFGPGWLRPAPPKIAFDNAAGSPWCTGFSGLSRAKNDNAGK